MPLVAAAVSAGGSLFGGILGSRASNKASKIQSDAATRSADMQAGAMRDSNQLQRDTLAQQQKNLQPYMDEGRAAVDRLGTDEFTKGWTGSFDSSKYDFDPATVTMDPGFKFRMDQANKALASNLAATGALRSGGGAKAIVNYNQDAASQEYGNAYGRAYTANADTYGRAVNSYNDAKSNFYTNQQNAYSRVSDAANRGFAATGSANADAAAAVANIGNTTINSTNSQAASLEGGANARAAGVVGSANAWTGALTNAGNAFMNAAAIKSVDPSRNSSYDSRPYKQRGIYQ